LAKFPGRSVNFEGIALIIKLNNKYNIQESDNYFLPFLSVCTFSGGSNSKIFSSSLST